MSIILCRVVWASNYSSMKESFYAGNMKYPKEHNEAHELANYKDEDGYACGFVEGNGDRINLSKLKENFKGDKIEGVTVIWCAVHKVTNSLRVVGWYKNAIAYSSTQSIKSGRSRRAYYFKAKFGDVKLLPEADRYLEVPTRNKIADKGFIGQKNWFFPESSARYETFLQSFLLLQNLDETEPDPEFNQNEFDEGQRKIAEINISARNQKLVIAAKSKYGLSCQVCKFNFEKRYGALGQGYIEVHHLNSLGSLKGNRKSSVEDVRVLCANCHRMVHRKAQALTLEELQKFLIK